MNPAALQRAGAGGGGGDYVEGEEVVWSFLCPPPPPTSEENLLVPLPYFRGRLKTVAMANKTPWQWGPGPGERLGTARPAARVRCALNAARCAAHTPSNTAVLLPGGKAGPRTGRHLPQPSVLEGGWAQAVGFAARGSLCACVSPLSYLVRQSSRGRPRKSSAAMEPQASDLHRTVLFATTAYTSRSVCLDE